MTWSLAAHLLLLAGLWVGYRCGSMVMPMLDQMVPPPGASELAGDAP